MVALDFGFQYPFASEDVKFGFLTHTHRDHSGGLKRALEGGMWVFASESTVRQLDLLAPLPGQLRRKLIPVRPPIDLLAGDEVSITVAPGSHVPGAVMVRIASDQREIVYSGDYCLNNAFFHQHTDVVLQLFTGLRKKRFLLLDSAFVGHQPRAVGTIRKVEALITEAHQQERDVVVVAPSADYLYCLYIWLFHCFYAGGKHPKRNLLVHSRVLRLLETTLDTFIGRQRKGYDPFLRALLAKSMENPFESFRLYEYRHGEELRRVPGAIDVLCEAEFLDQARTRCNNPLVIHVGRAATATQLTEVICVDGPDLSFHSSESDVIAMARSAIRREIRPVLFHNYAERLRARASAFGLHPRTYSIARGELEL